MSGVFQTGLLWAEVEKVSCPSFCEALWRLGLTSASLCNHSRNTDAELS